MHGGNKKSIGLNNDKNWNGQSSFTISFSSDVWVKEVLTSRNLNKDENVVLLVLSILSVIRHGMSVQLLVESSQKYQLIWKLAEREELSHSKLFRPYLFINKEELLLKYGKGEGKAERHYAVDKTGNWKKESAVWSRHIQWDFSHSITRNWFSLHCTQNKTKNQTAVRCSRQRILPACSAVQVVQLSVLFFTPTGI